MKLTKKLIPILLSSALLCPNTWAMKSSISVPEDMDRYAYSEEKDNKDSPYELEKACSHIIREAPHTPIDQTICDTAYTCNQTFRKLGNFLHNKEVPSDCFYIAGLSNYENVLADIDYILFNVILSQSDNTKLFFTPSEETRKQLCNAIFMVEWVIEKYEGIFNVELFLSFAPRTKTKQLYALLTDIREGIWRISQLNSFND